MPRQPNPKRPGRSASCKLAGRSKARKLRFKPSRRSSPATETDFARIFSPVKEHHKYEALARSTSTFDFARRVLRPDAGAAELYARASNERAVSVGFDRVENRQPRRLGARRTRQAQRLDHRRSGF